MKADPTLKISDNVVGLEFFDGAQTVTELEKQQGSTFGSKVNRVAMNCKNLESALLVGFRLTRKLWGSKAGSAFLTRKVQEFSLTIEESQFNKYSCKLPPSTSWTAKDEEHYK